MGPGSANPRQGTETSSRPDSGQVHFPEVRGRLIPVRGLKLLHELAVRHQMHTSGVG